MKLQKSVKIKFLFIAALALSFLMAIGTFFGVTFASAARTVTISGTSIFITSSKAEVWAHQIGEDDAAEYYTMFAFPEDDSSVNYRKNLAFKWIENAAEQEEASKDETNDENAEGTETPATPIEFNKQVGWFNMEIGFKDKNNAGDNGDENSLQFKQFVITFESQQYSQTKDGKSTNYIVFEPAGEGQVKVYVTGKGKDDKNLNAVLARLGDGDSLGTVANDHININFVDPDDHKNMTVEGGDYLVQVSNGDDNKSVGTFKNIGKTYSKYSSSTVTPLSFKAVFEEEDGEDNHGNAYMTLYNMNGQSFKFTNSSLKTDGKITNGTVDDTTPPVLCLDKAVPFIKYNSEISFDYTVIDVLASSPSLTTSYYMLTTADKDKVPVYSEDGGNYKKVTDSDNQYIYPHAKHYQPKSEYGDFNPDIYDDNFEVMAAVKVVLTLTDASSNGQTTYVYLDWFVDKDYLITMKTATGGEVNYIAVTTDKLGATYAYTKGGESDPDSEEWDAIVKAYQARVTEAAKGLKAGNKNYFYLPSAETLLSDNAIPYEDLNFSIYYNNGTQQSSTGKNANALSISLTKAGTYKFTVYAKDTAGNGMYYYDEDGEKQDLDTGDIWNIFRPEKDSKFVGMKKYLPWFVFTVAESEISIEDPDEQSTAYVGSSFTPDSFEINGVSVKPTYSLYEFQNDKWATAENGGKAMTYKYFSENAEMLLKEYRQYFTLIRPTSELKEGTKDYEAFNAYGWKGSSLSFTPQTANAFYVIKCEASSSNSSATAQTATKCMTIAAAPKVKTLKGEDTWVQDNVTSIILLCIAGASLIGIILLIVIKPKNKGDLDEVIGTPKKIRKTK